MSEDRRKSDRTSSSRPGVTYDQAGHAVAGAARSHRNVKFEARRR